MTRLVLTLNAGSSSVKFGAYDAQDARAPLAEGQVENLGPNARLKYAGETRDLGATDHKGALREILSALAPVLEGREVAGVGHRIVHGGVDYAAPIVLDNAALDTLRALVPLAPLHQPHNLAAVDAARETFPDAVQVGCFDTAFHRDHPWVNDTFALPRRFYDEGVRRYGFHGLSYDYITSHIATGHPELAEARVVIAHLGNGASMCATRGGKSVGSSMGFSALDGLPMGTRCGQIDPGVLLYLMDKGMTAGEISALLYKESGLKGLSGIGSDMRTLLESDAPEAEEAVAYFTTRVAREVGAMAAILGGIDALVFTGGIGEHAAPVRARICEGLGFLGLTVDATANAESATEIGTGPARILVIPTDEEGVIARATCARL